MDHSLQTTREAMPRISSEFDEFIGTVIHELNFKYQGLSSPEQYDKAGRAEITIRDMVVAFAAAVGPNDALNKKIAALRAILAIFTALNTSQTIIATEIKSLATYADWGRHLMGVCAAITQEEMGFLIQEHANQGLKLEGRVARLIQATIGSDPHFKMLEAFALLVRIVNGD